MEVIILSDLLYYWQFFKFSFWCKWKWMHSGDVICECRNFIFIGWRDKKLVVVSVVDGFRNMFISKFVGFRIRRRFRVYIYTLNVVIFKCVYRVSQEEWIKLRESVPYVKVYQYNPKHLYPKLNGYGDNGQRSLKLWQLFHTYWLPSTYRNWQEYVVSVMLISVLNIKITCEWHKAIKLNYKISKNCGRKSLGVPNTVYVTCIVSHSGALT